MVGNRARLHQSKQQRLRAVTRLYRIESDLGRRTATSVLRTQIASDPRRVSRSAAAGHQASSGGGTIESSPTKQMDYPRKIRAAAHLASVHQSVIPFTHPPRETSSSSSSWPRACNRTSSPITFFFRIRAALFTTVSDSWLLLLRSYDASSKSARGQSGGQALRAYVRGAAVAGRRLDCRVYAASALPPPQSCAAPVQTRRGQCLCHRPRLRAPCPAPPPAGGSDTP